MVPGQQDGQVGHWKDIVDADIDIDIADAIVVEVKVEEDSTQVHLAAVVADDHSSWPRLEIGVESREG